MRDAVEKTALGAFGAVGFAPKESRREGEPRPPRGGPGKGGDADRANSAASCFTISSTSLLRRTALTGGLVQR